MYGIKRSREHPHLGATYKIIRMKDKSYGVEVAIPDAFPATVTGLATKEDADSGLSGTRTRSLQGSPQRSNSTLARKLSYFEYCRNQPSGASLQPIMPQSSAKRPRALSLCWWWRMKRSFGP